MKTNYNLKKEVLENGCCNSLKKKSLSQWKISQLQKEYDFMLSGVNVFGEMAFTYKELEAVGEELNKAKYFYDVANKEIRKRCDWYLRAWGYSNTNLFQSDLDNIANDSQIKQNYTYFKITNITKNNSGNQCIPIAYDISNSAWQNITENIEYELSDYNNIWIKGYSYQNGALASCSMKVTFYNK